MKKGLLVLFIGLLIVPIVFSMMAYPGKCVQRGFEFNKTGCSLPDGTYCTYESFEAGICGLKYQNDGFCVKLGDAVWGSEGYECCEGLKSYLSPGVDGQTTCQPLSERFKRNISSPFLLFKLGIIIIGIAFILIFFWIVLKKFFRKKISNK